MTGEEAKAALLSQCPVMWDGKEYEYIQAIVYEKSRYGGVLVTARLADKCGRSFVNAKLKDVELIQIGEGAQNDGN